MREQCSIATVTVAYNGAEVLRSHLDSLRGQTRKPDEIIVIDNASGDNTIDLLASEYPEVTVLDQRENIGVGGGLAAGLEYAALHRKHDWVWLFDQDSVPAPDCLERLLAGLQHPKLASQRVAILAPVCIHSETGMRFPGLCWKGSRLLVTPSSNQDVSFFDSVISSGTLIRREAVEAVGLPRTDFFIDFVDHEHCFRLRRQGFVIAVVPDSFLEHAIGEPRKIKILGWTRYWTDHVPWREYYMTRNLVYVIWHDYPHGKGFTTFCLAKHVVGIFLFGRGKLPCISMMWRGFLDGRAGRLGIRFLPHSESHPKRSALKSEACAERVS